MHERIKPLDMTWPWMTQPQSAAHRPEWDRFMMPLLQTSAHYPEMSKQNNRSSNGQGIGTLSISPIQEHADSAKTSPSTMTHSTGIDWSKKRATSPSHNQELTAITTLSIIVTAMLMMTLVLWEHRISNVDNPILSETRIDQATMKPMQQTTQNAECPKCGHRLQEGGLLYKNPPGNTTYSPSKLPNFPPVPSTPNNLPDNPPCLPPSPIPPLQLRSENSGSKERLTTTLGKATTSFTHGGAMTTVAIPGTAARQQEATKTMLPTRTTTGTHGTHVWWWVVTKVKVIPRNCHTPPIMMRTLRNEPEIVSPHHGTFCLDKSTWNLTMSSPTLPTNNSLTTLHFKCLGNASPSTILRASASTCAWMAPHNDS